jgi:asparagine synthetase B (glutamine-hydrolysing)
MLFARTGETRDERPWPFARSGVGALDRLDGARGTLGVWAEPGDARIDRARQAAIQGVFLPATDGVLSPEAVGEARGDFAVMALTPEGVLVGSGSVGGYRAVYVASLPEGQIACTRLEPLLASLPSPPPLDPDFVARSAVLEPWLDPTGTPYLGVRQVPPGEAWLLGGDSIRRHRVVRPLLDPEAKGSGAELAHLVRDALERAICRAVNGSSRFAIAASGGLDSSALVGLACALARQGKLTSTPSVYHWSFDVPPPRGDRPYVQALARHVGVAVTPITPQEATPYFRDHLVVDAAPCFFPVLPLWTALAVSAKRHGTDVVISGEGGDQVMNGQPLLIAELVRRGSTWRALSLAATLRGAGAGTFRSRMRDWILRPQVARLAPEGLRRARRRATLRERYPWAGPRLRSYLDRVSELSPRRPSLDWTPRERYQDLITTPSFEIRNIIRSQEEVAGAHVRRDPFMDDDFLRVLATIPALALFEGGYFRGLQREIMRELVPEEVRLRETKANMTSALVAAMAPVGGFALVEHLVDVRMMADAGLVEPSLFRARFESLVRRPIDAPWLDVWAVLATEAFLRRREGSERGPAS